MLFKTLLLVLLITVTTCAIDFTDCGSNHFDVIRVEVEHCVDHPCEIYIGEKRQITIHAENIDKMSTTAMHSRAAIRIRGHQWPIQITPENPCSLWSCPLTSMKERKFTGKIRIQNNVMLGPARLEVNLSTSDGSQAICIEFPIDINRFPEEETEEAETI